MGPNPGRGVHFYKVLLCRAGQSLLRRAYCAVFLSPVMICFLFLFLGDTINIGDVSYKLKTPKSPELVPQNYSKKY